MAGHCARLNWSNSLTDRAEFDVGCNHQISHELCHKRFNCYKRADKFTRRTTKLCEDLLARQRWKRKESKARPVTKGIHPRSSSILALIDKGFLGPESETPATDTSISVSIPSPAANNSRLTPGNKKVAFEMGKSNLDLIKECDKYNSPNTMLLSLSRHRQTC